MAVEVYGAWGQEAQHTSLATRLVVKTSIPKSKALCSIYTRMNLTLIRANAKALVFQSVLCIYVK